MPKVAASCSRCGGGVAEVVSSVSVVSSSTSITHNPAPTFATSPSLTRISFTIPSNGLVISTLALSLWTSQSASKDAMVSVGLILL